MNKQLKSKRTGSVLLLAVLASVIVLLTGIGLLELGSQTRIRSIRTAQRLKARCAADAGVVKAIVEMNNQLKAKTWSDSAMPAVTDEALLQSNASFSYQVGKDDSGTYTITSAGTAGPLSKRVYATVALKGLFDSAILVKNRISLMPGTLVAGYNSADATDSEFKLEIGTMGTLDDSIPLGPGTVVEGDVYVGVGGNPETVIGSGGTITGKKYALTEEPDLPVITPPLLPDWGTALSAIAETITLGPSDSGTYTEIDLSQAKSTPGALEIQGGDVALHITGNINIGTGCELIVRPGSSLVLYIDGDISADNSVGINNEAGNVRDFQLYATGTEAQVFNLKAKSSVFGTVYAPNVIITLYPNTKMCGAIVGESVTFKSGSIFYYDEALRDNVSTDEEGVRFEIKRWRDE